MRRGKTLVHGHNLRGHAIWGQQDAERIIRLVSRTNCLLENSFNTANGVEVDEESRRRIWNIFQPTQRPE